MIDNKGRLFGKINIVDLLIVLLIVTAIGATVYKFGFSAHSDVNESDLKIEYVLKTRGVREFTSNSINPGDEIYDEETDDFIGIVTDVRKEEAMDFITKADGTIEYVPKPERYDVFITVESDARFIGGGYFAGGTKEIGVFSNISIYSQDFACMTEVQSVGEKN